jgi:hypothetical protein
MVIVMAVNSIVQYIGKKRKHYGLTSPFNTGKVDRLLNDCAKCMKAIILSPMEFEHLQRRFCEEAVTAYGQLKMSLSSLMHG